MRTYLTFIRISQTVLLAISIAMLLVLPAILAFWPDSVNQNLLYTLAHVSLLLVMTIRPLADLLPGLKVIRPLVILRKGMGVFSASIIVSFIMTKIIIDYSAYFSSLATTAYWSLDKLALLAHLADISAVLLLITSNNLSKRILGAWWKRVQRLSYVYFYGSTIYLMITYQDMLMLIYLTVVTLLTALAYEMNQARREEKAIAA
ncbi:MAG: hypothetical protein RLZZ230_292 [Candidatus Parcubacteria bacterium]|jgi:DMSO/TMAO reductase YedYZ heme-binding membrane subunit